MPDAWEWIASRRRWEHATAGTDAIGRAGGWFPGADAVKRRLKNAEALATVSWQEDCFNHGRPDRGRFGIRVKSGHKAISNGSGCGSRGSGRSVISRTNRPKRRICSRI